LTALFVISFTANQSGNIFAGTYFGGGVFRSTDNGDTWVEKNNGVVATDIRAIATFFPFPSRLPASASPSGFIDTIFVGTYGLGMFRSFDSGQTWEKINNGLPALYVRSLAATSGGSVLFAGADFVNGAGGVYRSTDGGDNWIEVNGGVIQTDVRALAVNSSGDIFAGTYFGGGVFRSTDNGDSWTPVNEGLECGNIWSLAINIQSGTIFAGTAGCGEGVYRSTDNGDSWALTNSGLTSTDIAALAINDSGYIFAGTQSQMGQGGGMFRSTDNGETWTEQNTGFAARDVNAVVVNQAGYIFAGAAGGVFRSINDADGWSNVSSGLVPPGGNVWALGFGFAGRAYAGTAGGGLFRSVDATVPVPLPPRPRPTPHPRPTP
jgi:photosystem II stability/assembly factor-like uncharacterized protein